MGLTFWFSVAFIIYTYAGYPFLLWLLAKGFGRQKTYQPSEPTVTLLIAAYNEEDVIAQKLENSLALDYPPDKLQILVAAEGSADRTALIVSSYKPRGVELSHAPQRHGKMAAINRAVQAARGEVIIFSDANNHYPAGTLRALLAPFSDPKVGAVTGAKSIVTEGDGLSESEGLYWKYESFIKKQESRLSSTTGVAGEILAVRRELYTPPPNSVINDDFFIALHILRLGFQVKYVPEARSLEQVSATTQDEVVRRARIVAGRYQAMSYGLECLPWRNPILVWQLFSHKFFRPLLPFAMLGAVLANLAALFRPGPASAGPVWRLAKPYNWMMLGLQGIFYSLALLGKFNRSKNRLSKLLFLPTFLVNSNLAALIGLYQYATGTQSALWQRVSRRQVSQPEEIIQNKEVP